MAAKKVPKKAGKALNKAKKLTKTSNLRRAAAKAVSSTSERGAWQEPV